MSVPAIIRSTPGRESRCPYSLVPQSGHSLVEVLAVLSLLGVCFAVGGVLLAHGLTAVQARGAAQGWQAAASWAQTLSMWQGTTSDLQFDSGHLAITASVGANGGDLGASAPPVAAFANIARWQRGEGVLVRFTGGTASPDSAGSLYFKASGEDYRVTVRLESGLTVRTRTEAAP
jgi:hypothetical protein